MRYRKIPVVIEALQFTGENHEEVENWSKGAVHRIKPSWVMEIHTLEGILKVSVNDYVIKGVKGEFYPCKPDIFRLTYEKVK